MIQFYTAYIIVLMIFLYQILKDRTTDVFFAPWPGFAFIFGTYFLASSAVYDGTLQDQQWTLYTLAIAGFFFGSTVSKLLFPFPIRKGAPLRHDLDSFIYNKTLNFSAIVVMVAVALACTAFMMAKVGPPLLAENVDAARVAYLDNGYLGEMAALLDVGAVFSIGYLLTRRDHGSGKWKTLAAVSIVILFIAVAILAGSRSRLLKVAVPAMFLFHFFRNGIPIKSLLVTTLSSAFFIGLLGYFRNLAKYGSSIAQGIGGEAASWGAFDYTLFFMRKELANGAYGLSEVIRVIPAKAPFQEGLLHIAPFVAPLGIKIPNPGDFFKSAIGGTWDGFGLAATFISPMYADFGTIGVFSLSVVYAFIFTFIYLLTRLASPTAAYWACVYAMLFYVMISGMRSDMVSFEALWFAGAAIMIKLLSYRQRRVRYLVDLYSAEDDRD